MRLAVTSIRFLASGKISVEVSGESTANPPTPPALDAVSMRLYMECAPADTVSSIKEQALRLARETIRGAS